MNDLAVADAHWVHGERRGKWTRRSVFRRVELVIDGEGVTSLVDDAMRGQGVFDGYVTPFEVDPDRGRDAFLGFSPFQAWMPDHGRLPVLMCSCGDLLCGAVTVAFETGDEHVRWFGWSWENFYEPAEPIDLPAVTFATSAYVANVDDAGRRAEAGPHLLTRMRVRQPGPWWRNVGRVPEGRRDRAAMLGWLQAEAVEPTIGDAEGDYLQFLEDLRRAQSLLAGVAGHVHRLRADEETEAVRRLSQVEASPHSRSLPFETTAAVEWFLSGLRT